MPRFAIVLLTLMLAACSTGPDLQIPKGVVEFELREIVTDMNPLWDPVERAVTGVRLLEGRRVSDDRYEFDAEYEMLCITKRDPIKPEELRRMAESMRSQGREAEWEQLDARRKTSEAYLAERVSDMKPGEKRWFRDTFVLVQVGGKWVMNQTGNQ